MRAMFREKNEEIEGVVYCRDCEEPLCEQCKQDHGRIKVSKYHKLCDLADVPPREINDLLKSLIACPNHDKEEAVYLCKDHDVTCCSKCAMADHRKCEEVKVLSDILHKLKVECGGLKTVLGELQQKCESLLEHERKHEEMIAETESKSVSLLQDIKQKLLDTFNMIEKKVVSSIADNKKLIFEKMGAQREHVHQILKEIERQSSSIKQVEKFGTEDHVVLVQRKIEKETLLSLQLSVIDFEKSRTQSSFKCTENTCVDTLLKEIWNSFRIDDTVCDVSETGSDIDIKKTSTYTERVLQLQSEIGLCEMQLIDKKDYKPDTCIWIDHHIVISFMRVPSLVVFKEDAKTVLSHFNCPSIPGTVSKTGPTDMVITLPGESKIVFAQLRRGNIHLVAEMTTIVPYNDVARDTELNQYICLSSTAGQIDVLDNDGTSLHSLSVSSDIITCIKSALHLALDVNSRTLFLSECVKNTITAINLQGKKVFDYKHKNLSIPWQCVVHPSGNIYVACAGVANTHQIGPTGKYIRSLLLKEIDATYGLCFNDTFDKLAVVGGTDKQYYMRVYTYI